LDIF